MNDENRTYKYAAFISYTRGGDDEKIAKWLQKRLESFKVPTGLAPQSVKGGELREADFAQSGIDGRRLKIFRDKTDLGPHPALTEALMESLDMCRSLVVICSPRSAKSKWVNEEVRYFQQTRRASRIIPFIIEGSPTPGEGREQCYPPDLSDKNLGVTLADGAREEAPIKVVAGMLGVEFGSLYSRHLRAQAKVRAIFTGLVLCALTVVSSFAVWAYRAELRATAQRKEAEGLVRFLTIDLRDDMFSHVPLKAKQKVTDKVEEYYGKWEAESVEARYYKALHLSNLAMIALDSGNGKNARSLAAQAMDLLAPLRRETPDDTSLQIAEIESATVLLQVLSYAFEENMQTPDYKPVMDMAVRLAEKEPGSPLPRKLALGITGAYAAFEDARENVDQAIEIYERAVNKAEEDALLFPEDRIFSGLLYDILGRLCTTKNRNARNGLPECKRAVAGARAWVAEDPGNLVAQQTLIRALDTQLTALVRSGSLEQAKTVFDELQPLQEAAWERDPDNAIWEIDRIRAAVVNKERSLRSGEPDDAGDAEKLLEKAMAVFAEGENAFGYNHRLMLLRQAIAFFDFYINKNRFGYVYKKEHEEKISEARKKYEEALADATMSITNKRSTVSEFYYILLQVAYTLKLNAHAAESLPYFREALAVAGNWLEREPENRKLFASMLKEMGTYIHAFVDIGELTKAQTLAAQAKELLEEEQAAGGGSRLLCIAARHVYNAEASLADARGDIDSVVGSMEGVLDFSEKATRYPDATMDDALFVWYVREVLAQTYDTACSYDKARPLHALVTEEYRQAAQVPLPIREDSETASLGVQLVNLATHHNDLGEKEQALAALREAKEVTAKPLPANRPRETWQYPRLAILGLEAKMFFDAGDHQAALAKTEEALGFDSMSREWNFFVASSFMPDRNWYMQKIESQIQLNMYDNAFRDISSGKIALKEAVEKAPSLERKINEAYYAYLEAKLFFIQKDYAAAEGKINNAFKIMAAYVNDTAYKFGTDPALIEKGITLPAWHYYTGLFSILAGDIQKTLGNKEFETHFFTMVKNKAEIVKNKTNGHGYWRIMSDKIAAIP